MSDVSGDPGRAFRFFGHLLGDDSRCIPAGEMAAARRADPIPAYRKALLDRQILEAALDTLDEAIAAEVADAAAYCPRVGLPRRG